VTHNPGMLEDRVASDCFRGPRCRHVAILGAPEDGKAVDLKVEGCHATADFAVTTCLTLIPAGQSPPSSLPDNTSRFGEDNTSRFGEEGRRVRDAGSEYGRGNLSGQRGGRHRGRLAPNPYVLSKRRGPLHRDELVAIDAWWRAANYLAVGQIYLSANPLLREPLQPNTSGSAAGRLRHGAGSEFSVSDCCSSRHRRR
jgi:XFP N-terminal domain